MSGLPDTAPQDPGAHIVIIGAGQAGLMAAEALRSGGSSAAITLLGDEPHAPYHRPPLSKAWLAGEVDAAQLLMRAPEMLARKQITLRTGSPVQAIDRAAQQVRLADGSALPYTGLVLATGATPRRLPLPGAEAESSKGTKAKAATNAVINTGVSRSSEPRTIMACPKVSPSCRHRLM